MSPIAILFGVLLTALGPTLYALSSEASRSPTAFIPAGFGIALIVLGILARNDNLRKHVMHVAAILGLIGFAVPAVMVGRALMGGATFEPVKHGGQLTMAVLCGVFLALCIKSFVDARKARQQAQNQTPQ
jgi:uncharacterized membrane protein